MTVNKPRSIIVAKNTFWNLTTKGIDFTGNLAASILIARVLGVEGFGQYSFVVAFATLFSMGMDWGLEHVFVREISRREGDGSREFSVVLGLKFLFQDNPETKSGALPCSNQENNRHHPSQRFMV